MKRETEKLTTTEIKIVIAQIEDRLMRVAKAQDELGAIADEEEWDKVKAVVAKLRIKYKIPEGVHLFFESVDPALTKGDVNTCKPHITAFVRGKLTEEAMEDLLFYFEEEAECDYGWILVERPMGFYHQPSTEKMGDVIRDIKAIGTRSRSKNTKLPRIAGVWSS